MSLSRKTVLGIILFVLVLMLPFVLFLLPVWDGPPPDDAEMMVPPRQIPEDRNAYDLYMRAHALMRHPGHAERQKWRENPAEYRDEIQAWFEGNREAFQILYEGIARGDLQVPWNPREVELYGVSEILDTAKKNASTPLGKTSATTEAPPGPAETDLSGQMPRITFSGSSRKSISANKRPDKRAGGGVLQWGLILTDSGLFILYDRAETK